MHIRVYMLIIFMTTTGKVTTLGDLRGSARIVLLAGDKDYLNAAFEAAGMVSIHISPVNRAHKYS